jgi:hypothetical protein
MTMTIDDEVIRKVMSEMGKKGGKKKGESKRRGGREFYSRIAKLRHEKKPKPEPTPDD